MNQTLRMRRSEWREADPAEQVPQLSGEGVCVCVRVIKYIKHT